QRRDKYRTIRRGPRMLEDARRRRREPCMRVRVAGRGRERFRIDPREAAGLDPCIDATAPLVGEVALVEPADALDEEARVLLRGEQRAIAVQGFRPGCIDIDAAEPLDVEQAPRVEDVDA